MTEEKFATNKIMLRCFAVSLAIAIILMILLHVSALSAMEAKDKNIVEYIQAQDEKIVKLQIANYDMNQSIQKNKETFITSMFQLWTSSLSGSEGDLFRNEIENIGDRAFSCLNQGEHESIIFDYERMTSIFSYQDSRIYITYNRTSGEFVCYDDSIGIVECSDVCEWNAETEARKYALSYKIDNSDMNIVWKEENRICTKQNSTYNCKVSGIELATEKIYTLEFQCDEQAEICGINTTIEESGNIQDIL